MEKNRQENAYLRTTEQKQRILEKQASKTIVPCRELSDRM